MARGSTLTEKSKVWRGIWHAEAPPRCRSLAWRACNEDLPVRTFLLQRRLVEDATCQCCGACVETTLHALLLCEEARLVWFASPLGLRVDALGRVESLGAWVEECAEVLDERGMGMVCAVMWALWHKRNLWVFERVKLEVREVLSVVYSLFCVSEIPHQWVPPKRPFVKANFGALVRDNVGTGFGLIFRDSFARILASGTNFLDEKCYGTEVAEAQCYKWALEQSGKLGFSDIIFETSCEKLHTAWMKAQEKTKCDSELDSLLEECRMMIKDTNSFLTLILPSANKVAQSLANVAFDYGEKVWMGVVAQEASIHLKSDRARAFLSTHQ